MPLPTPAARTHLHTRAVTFEGYLREDGLWDIEAVMRDTRTYAARMHGDDTMPPGTPVHNMLIRLTVDDTMTVREVATAMDHTPFDECQQGNDPMQRMVGAVMGKGWRHAIDKAVGGPRGCTHLRELLFNMATAAYQTVFPYREHQRQQAGVPPSSSAEPPYHLGGCIAWDFDGPVVERHYPQFAGWKPLTRVSKPPAERN